MLARSRRLPVAGRTTAAAALLALAFVSAATCAAGSAEHAHQQEAQSAPLVCEDGFELGGRKYNFTNFTRTYDVVFSDSNQTVNYHYAIRFCDNLPTKNCDNARVCEESRKYGNGPEGVVYKQLAGEEAPIATLGEVGDPSAQPTVTLSFKEISGAPHVSVILSCDPDVDDSAVKPLLRSKDAATIIFAWQTKAACAEAPKSNPPPQPEPTPKEPEPKPTPDPQPQPPTPQPDKPADDQPPPKTAEPEKKGMSAAGVFFLVLFVCVASYFIAGIYYNRTVYGAHGWDLIPHSDFWRELPSLVSDVVRHMYNSLFNRGPSGYSSMA